MDVRDIWILKISGYQRYLDIRYIWIRRDIWIQEISGYQKYMDTGDTGYSINQETGDILYWRYPDVRDLDIRDI